MGCLRLLTDWQVRGSENVPKEGALLIVANHLNNVDPPLLAVSIPRKTTFMAKEELFRSRIVSYFVSRFGAFLVQRGTIDRNALRRAKEILDSGECLVMFPEGRRSRSGAMLPAFRGSALIALQNEVKVLPVGITGTEKLVGNTWFFRRHRIVVTIGQPFRLAADSSSVKRDKLTNLTDDMMCHIAGLLPAAYRGCYTGKILEYANRKVL